MEGEEASVAATAVGVARGAPCGEALLGPWGSHVIRRRSRGAQCPCPRLLQQLRRLLPLPPRPRVVLRGKGDEEERRGQVVGEETCRTRRRSVPSQCC